MSDPKPYLKPTTPVLSGRYDKSHRVDIEPQTINIGLFTGTNEPEPEYLPKGWRLCAHPEGAIYFCTDAEPDAETEENIPSTVTSTELSLEQVGNTSSPVTFVESNVETGENTPPVVASVESKAENASSAVTSIESNVETGENTPHIIIITPTESNVETGENALPAAAPPAKLKVITTEDISSTEILDRVQYFIEMVEGMFEDTGVPLSDSYELYLEFDQDGVGCGYYLVDHSTRCIFWLEKVWTEDLQINPAFSTQHLRHGLEDLYWSHVEFYPSHDNIPTDGLVAKMLETLAHAYGDALTSNVSTFPYSAKPIARFMKLLEPYRTTQLNHHILCVVARLNSHIAASRYYHHSGLPHCRLSRDQRIIDIEPSDTYWLSSNLSKLLFGVPASFVDKFELLFVDTVVYINDFQQFFENCQEERRMFINLSFGAIMMHFGLIATGSGLGCLSPVGLLSGIASIVSGVVLHSQHQGMTRALAGEGYAYLSERRHDTYGFQHLALVFSLPKAMFLWSIALLVPQAFFLLYTSIGEISFFLLIFLSTWFALVFQYKLVPGSFHWLPSKKTSEGNIELPGDV